MFVVDFHVHISHHYLPWVSEYAAAFRHTSGLARVVDEHGRMHPEPLAEVLAEEDVNYAVILAEMSPVTTGGYSSHGLKRPMVGSQFKTYPNISRNRIANTYAGVHTPK